MRKIEFEYWSDPLCIWALVAQPKLEQVLERWGDVLCVRYHVVPVFGSVGWRFREGPWAKGGPEGRAAATRKVAEQHGLEVSGQCWLEDCPSSSWGAGAALKAVFAMEEAEEVPAGSGAEYQLAMRRRFFLDGKNVARREVQLNLAEELSIPRASMAERLDDGTAIAALWEDQQRKDKLGIQGSPTYVFDGGRAELYGNFSVEILTGTIEGLVRGADAGGSAC